MLAYPAQAGVGPGTLCHRSESPLYHSPRSAGWVCPPEGIEEGVGVGVDVCVCVRAVL